MNRSVMLNSKVVDYVNFILRAGEFKKCDTDKVKEYTLALGMRVPHNVTMGMRVPHNVTMGMRGP